MTDPSTRDVWDGVSALYQRLLGAWTARAADEYAALFADDADVIGFDGSTMHGRAEITATLAAVFADHQTGRYVGIVRGVRSLGPTAALLSAVAGLVPHGQTDINPAINAIQSLVAVAHADGWRIAVFQNTPAQFHGRPDLAEQLTGELRDRLETVQR